MCSISGIIRIADSETRSSELEPAALVERMNAALRHRGPDDQGVSSFEFRVPSSDVQVGLGNTRLAILDLSAAGHQPMQDTEAGLTITYNGEIYNFRELRAEIGDTFGPWQSNTDTEVVLRAYRLWGAAAFAKLRGMFALAIWDGRQQELLLVRDRFGIKPLYYYTEVRGQRPEVRSSLVFASEVRALLATGLVPRKLSKDGLASYLEYGSIQAPLTIIDEIKSLLPGHYLRVQAGEAELRIDDFEFANLKDRGLTLETQRTQGLHAEKRRDEAVAILKEKLRESVRLHLVSDVPLGVFLSGGMDSSALVALMSRVTKEKPKTFSVVFDEAQFSEAPHSRLVAEEFQTDHHEIHLSEDQLLGTLPSALAAMDQPTMDGVNTFVVSRAVKEAGVTVALSGLGGDELFAGYSTFRRALRLKDMQGLPRGLRNSVSRVGGSLSNGVRQKKFWQLAGSDGSADAAYAVARQLFAPDQVVRLSGHNGPTANGAGAKSKPANSNSELDTVNQMSLLELQGYMANTLLRDTDFMSMAHSLEVRVPFVDSEVADYVLGLPGTWKLNGSRPKPLLADVVSDLLPAKFLARSKMGFTLPFEKWMQLGLRDQISNVFRDHERLSKSGLDSESVSKLWQRFQRGPASVGWSRPWSIYVLAKWCEMNEVVS
jgi:asparagine synthase (glutamine-hydrolysing)